VNRFIPTEEPAPSLSALGSASRIIVEGLLHRGELAALELREARTHAVATGAIAAVGVGFALFFGLAGTLVIAALVWESEYRVLILSLVALSYLIGAVAFGWWAYRRLRSWRPLGEIRRQLEEDCLCVQQYLSAKSQ
jgi:uncharacterized membrane protein YqjE